MKITTYYHLQKIVLLFWTLSASLAGCSHALPPASPTPTVEPSPTQGDYWPTQDWRTSTPEEQGMDSHRLEQMLDFIREQKVNSHLVKRKMDFHSLLIVRHGYIVSETYFQDYHPDTIHELYSCTKSFISTLIGIAL